MQSVVIYKIGTNSLTDKVRQYCEAQNSGKANECAQFTLDSEMSRYKEYMIRSHAIPLEIIHFKMRRLKKNIISRCLRTRPLDFGEGEFAITICYTGIWFICPWRLIAFAPDSYDTAKTDISENLSANEHALKSESLCEWIKLRHGHRDTILIRNEDWKQRESICPRNMEPFSASVTATKTVSQLESIPLRRLKTVRIYLPMNMHSSLSHSANESFSLRHSLRRQVLFEWLMAMPAAMVKPNSFKSRLQRQVIYLVQSSGTHLTQPTCAQVSATLRMNHSACVTDHRVTKTSLIYERPDAMPTAKPKKIIQLSQRCADTKTAQRQSLTTWPDYGLKFFDQKSHEEKLIYSASQWRQRCETHNVSQYTQSGPDYGKRFAAKFRQRQWRQSQRPKTKFAKLKDSKEWKNLMNVCTRKTSQILYKSSSKALHLTLRRSHFMRRSNIKDSHAYAVSKATKTVSVREVLQWLVEVERFVIRIGLNESQDRNCSSKQIQLPKAMFREGNERVVCSRL